jgi:2'-5' RNA ligase
VALLTAAALDAYRVASTARLLLHARRDHRLPPHGAGRATYVTAISRLPLDRARALAEMLEPLRTAAPQHYFYPPETLHITIRNLDGLHAGGLKAAASLLRATPTFELELRGLNVSSHTVFVQALPRDDALRSIRRRLDESLRASATPRPRVPAHFAHLNVVRFRGRVGGSLLAAVARRRSIELGMLKVTQIEIVETDRLLSPAGTRTVERIALGAG